MFRIGVIGCGWIMRLSHIPAILKTPEGIITAFYSRTRKSAENTMKGYHYKVKQLLKKTKDPDIREYLLTALKSAIYTNLEEFFTVIDAVDIATSPNTHMMYAKMAAIRGKSIMLEKPAARTLVELENVYSIIKNVPLYMYTQRMYDNGIDFGKQIINSGKLGAIRSFRGCLGNAVLSYVHNKKQFWDPKISGGGALLDLGPHVYSVFRNWFGLDYTFESVKEIDIATVKKIRKQFGQKDYRVQIDDKAIVECKFNNPDKGDITARIEAYWGNRDLYPVGATRGYYFEVIGEQAKLSYPNINKTTQFYKIEYTDGIVETIPVNGKLFSTGEENTFRAFIRKEKSKNPGWFVREMMVILEGGYISHHLGGTQVTEDDIFNFLRQFQHIKKCEQRSLALIDTLFPIEKEE